MAKAAQEEEDRQKLKDKTWDANRKVFTATPTEDTIKDTTMATNTSKETAQGIISGEVKPEPIAPIAEQNQYITGTKTSETVK